MPPYQPETKWVPAPADYKPVSYGSVYPPIQKTDGGLIIDQCKRIDGGYDVIIFDNHDHPNMALLPKNCPRIVKQLYKKEYQLRMLRATDAWGLLADMVAAEKAWELFIANTSQT